MTKEEKKKKLQKIAERVNQCQECSLYRWANKGVPGEGDVETRVMFIGEGPGFHEDQQGRPFVGAAGRLLEQSLASINLRRDQVWIGNVVKHRPPENRDPQPAEIEACRPYLDEQIKTISPKVIVTLGRFSMGKFLPGEFISRIHGQAKFVEFLGRKYVIMPMYHPAAALRNGEVMRLFREDFARIPGLLGGRKESNKQGESEETGASEKKEEDESEQLSLI